MLAVFNAVFGVITDLIFSLRFLCVFCGRTISVLPDYF